MIIKVGRLISRKLLVLTTLSLLLATPILSSGQAAAMTMDSTAHEATSDCATVCAKASSPSAQQPAAVLDSGDEDQMPEPLPPDTATCLGQFFARHHYKILKPAQLYRSASFVPPDLVTLYENYRI
ncbi:MAG: hypothetical protein ABI602_03045 [Candidatus Saccharibacteria bacterium]